MKIERWRKSSYSKTREDCVEVGVVEWRKSSYSITREDCVEVGLAPGRVGIRDTKNREAGHLTVPRTAWTAFTHAASNGALSR